MRGMIHESPRPDCQAQSRGILSQAAFGAQYGLTWDPLKGQRGKLQQSQSSLVCIFTLVCISNTCETKPPHTIA